MTLALTIAQNDRHVGLRDAEKLGYFGLGHGAFQAPDRGHLFGRQEFLKEGNATDIDGMLSIALVRRPFEVRENIVRFHAVNVIDDWKIELVRDESESHQSVNVYRLAPATSEEVDVSVAEFVGAWSENLSVYSSSLQSVADAVQASNATEIADLVEISEVGDVHGSPFFDDADIHEAGRPSGMFGLAVKNPSRASTYGGFAIMAAHSNTYNGRLDCLSH